MTWGLDSSQRVNLWSNQLSLGWGSPSAHDKLYPRHYSPVGIRNLGTHAHNTSPRSGLISPCQLPSQGIQKNPKVSVRSRHALQSSPVKWPHYNLYKWVPCLLWDGPNAQKKKKPSGFFQLLPFFRVHQDPTFLVCFSFYSPYFSSIS